MSQSSLVGRGTALVTGGCGFIGSHLADAILRAGSRVRLFDSLVRPGSELNLARLRQAHGSRLSFIEADVRDAASVALAAEGVDVIFHFAAQVAVTSSLTDPRHDFDVNVLGTVNVLEAARQLDPQPGVIFASTNKVYGNLEQLTFEPTEDGYQPRDEITAQRGVDEGFPIHLRTPYGCSKGSADQYVLDYGASFGLRTAVMRMSCIYGPWQMGNEDQGWLAHFVAQALAGRPITIYGDGMQMRDLLYIDDAVRAYLAAWEQLQRFNGAVFNLGGGRANAVSIMGAIGEVYRQLGQEPHLRFDDWREGDQLWFVSAQQRAQMVLGVTPQVDWREGLAQLLRWRAQVPLWTSDVDAAQ